MNNRIKNIVFISIIACSLLYLHWKKPSLENLKSLSFLEMCALFLVTAAGLAVLGYGYQRLLRWFHIDLPAREWFGLTACNAMFSYYLPAKAGTVVRAIYLQKKHGLKYSHYASLSAAAFLISLMVFSGTGLCAMFISSAVWRKSSNALGFFLAGSFAAAALVFFLARLFLSRNKETGIKKLDSLLGHIREGLSHFAGDKTPALQFGLLTAGYLLIAAYRLFLCFRFLDVKISFFQALLIRSLTQLSFLVSFIPGNLGLKEGIIVYLAGQSSVPLDQALLAALIDRIVGMVVIFGLGFVFSRVLLLRLDRP